MEGLKPISLEEALVCLVDKNELNRIFFRTPTGDKYERVADYKCVFDNSSSWNRLNKVQLFKEEK